MNNKFGIQKLLDSRVSKYLFIICISILFSFVLKHTQLIAAAFANTIGSLLHPLFSMFGPFGEIFYSIFLLILLMVPYAIFASIIVNRIYKGKPLLILTIIIFCIFSIWTIDTLRLPFTVFLNFLPVIFRV